ncbi:MAG: hypothetical protein Q7S03_00090 [bacterium]|nr:hypothetical protein [bacterium]
MIAQLEMEKTLVIKKEEKLRRFNHLQEKFTTFSDQRWIKTGEIVLLGLIFLLNFWLLADFFGWEDKTNVFSAPLLPFLVRMLTPFVPYEFGVRIWLIAFFLFLPITWYFFIKEISKRKLIGFLAALLMSLPVNFFLPSRIGLGLLGEDGPHIASLVFIPLVCLLLLKFLRHGHLNSGVFSAVGIVLVGLTSPFGLLVCFVFASIVVFSEMLLGQGRLKIIRFILVLLLAAGLSAFWYNPKFLYLTLESPQSLLIKQTFFNLLPISLFTIPILSVFGFLLFENRAHLQVLFIATFITLAFLALSLGAGFFNPTPSRFGPALGVAAAFLIALGIVLAFDFLRFARIMDRLTVSFFQRQLVGFGLLFLVCFFMVLISFLFRSELISLVDEQELYIVPVGKKVGIWEIREQTTMVEALFGYLLSGATLLVIIFLKLKISKQRG